MILLSLVRSFPIRGLPLVVMLVGCAPAPPPASGTLTAEEQAVGEVVTAFQTALKSRDAAKLWSLLDSESRADADRAAKTVREAYAMATAEQKAELEKSLGLKSDELAALRGSGFLKTKRFHGMYDEVPDSTIDKVAVHGDAATASYTEADGDKKKFSLVRQDGQWKLSVPMPKVIQP